VTVVLLDAPATLRACLFTLGAQTFALPVATVKEVVDFEEWTTVPRAPRAVVGVANLRGDVVPIVDAQAVLGLPARQRGRRLRTLVVVAGDRTAALVVDAVVGLATVDAGTPPEAGAPAVAAARVEAGGRAALLLDAARLLEALRS